MYTLFVLLFVLIFLRPFYLFPLFIPLLSPSLISTLLLVLIFVLIFVHLYSYSPLFYLLLLSPLYIHIICTSFSKKFSQKNKYAQSVPKNFPKIFTYYNYSSPLLFNRKVNFSYSFYKILNTKFWRLYETIKTNEKNYNDFGGTGSSLLSECILSRLPVSFGISITMETEAYLARVRCFS